MFGHPLIFHLARASLVLLLIRTTASLPVDGHSGWSIGQPPTSDNVDARLWHDAYPWEKHEVSLGSREDPLTSHTWQDAPSVQHYDSLAHIEQGSSHLAHPAFFHPTTWAHDIPDVDGWAATGQELTQPFATGSFQGAKSPHGKRPDIRGPESFSAGPSSEPALGRKRKGSPLFKQLQDKEHLGEASVFAGKLPHQQAAALPFSLNDDDESSPSPPQASDTGPSARKKAPARRRVPYQSFQNFNGDENMLLNWKENLRKVLGGRPVEISPVEPDNPSMRRVFLAQHSTAEQGYHPPFLSSSDDLQSHSPKGESHFLRGLSVRTQQVSDMPRGRPGDRVYVYYNSRANLDYLNKEYFNNRLQFLPLKREQLSRHTLTKLHSDRQVLNVLPPRTRYGLPLILARTEADTTAKQLTGLRDVSQTVSLWSPILYDGERYTAILYGMGQLDFRHIHEVRNRLELLHDSWPHIEYSPVYGIAKAVH